MTTATVGNTGKATATARHWIDGSWRDSAQSRDSIDPATGDRIGRYALAESSFREVARTPAMAGLAYYNLGLVASRQDDTTAAVRWF